MRLIKQICVVHLLLPLATGTIGAIATELPAAGLVQTEFIYTDAPGDLGALIWATSRRAAALLTKSRGTQIGASPEEGMVGLLLLEKALAVERLVLQQMMYDGAALGAVPNPAGYLPKGAPRVVPARLQLTVSISQYCFFSCSRTVMKNSWYAFEA